MDDTESIEIEQTGERRYTVITEILKDTDSVKIIDFSEQKLAQLLPKLGYLKNIEEMWLHDNQFRELPTTFKNLSTLRKLDISDTSLRSMKPIMELNLSELNCLNTKIPKTEIDAFQKLHPECIVKANPKVHKPLTPIEKVQTFFMICLIIGAAYSIIMFITPSSEEISPFLLGFIAFIFSTVLVAVGINWIVGKIWRNN